jgi:hypothetical protein
MRVEGNHAGTDVVWAVEVDGPSHFLQVRSTLSCVWYCHRSHSVDSFRERITSFQKVNRAHAQGATSGHLPTGSTLLKHRQLGQLGYKVVSVPYWEWDALCRDKDRERAYLSNALVDGLHDTFSNQASLAQ